VSKQIQKNVSKIQKKQQIKNTLYINTKRVKNNIIAAYFEQPISTVSHHCQPSELVALTHSLTHTLSLNLSVLTASFQVELG